MLADDTTRADISHGPAASPAPSPGDIYIELLEVAGFAGIEITETHRVHSHAASAIIRARTPA
jgi:arsenite methyltransferase